MRAFKLLFALFVLFAVTTLTPTARAADQDFNGRWDIQPHAKMADIQFTTTKAWWLGITGAGTPDMKIQFVGSPDGSLDDITIAKIQDGVLHFTWVPRPRHTEVTPDPKDRIEYEAKLVDGKLEGKMTGPERQADFHRISRAGHQ